MENRKLTLNEAEKVTGGGFTFDSWYEIRRNEANLKCPACESTGKLESLGMYWEGYGDGTRIAVDHMRCTSCGTFIALFPEQGEMVLVDKMGNYGEERFPAVF